MKRAEPTKTINAKETAFLLRLPLRTHRRMRVLAIQRGVTTGTLYREAAELLLTTESKKGGAP